MSVGEVGERGVQRGRRCWVIEREMARGGEEQGNRCSALLG